MMVHEQMLVSDWVKCVAMQQIILHQLLQYVINTMNKMLAIIVI